ncbi:Hsp20/alpha crystallin family protein [Desulfocurvus sp. DL9XJH121]
MVIDFGSFYEVPRHWDQLMEEFFGPSSLSQRRFAYPPLNIGESDDAVRVSALIPGLGLEDIELTLTHKTLVIKGERKAPEGKYFRQERPAGPFQRIISLNVPVDRDRVTATLKNGILDIVLPKAEAVRPKKIDIAIS